LAAQIKILRAHGQKGNNFVDYGYNFRMSDIQAAVLTGQLQRINAIIKKRIKLASNYDKLLFPLVKKGILKICPKALFSLMLKSTASTISSK